MIFFTWQPNMHTQRLPDENAQFSVRYVANCDVRAFTVNGILRQNVNSFQGIHRCFQFADSWPADVVHHLYLNLAEIPLYLNKVMKRKRSWKLFATLFGSYFLHSHETTVSLRRRRYDQTNQWATQQLLRSGVLSGLFVHTKRIRKELLQHWKNVDPRTVSVVPDPLEPFSDCSSQLAARKRLSLPTDVPIVLYFGDLRWHKGPDILLEAIPLVEKECYWVIAGEPRFVVEEDIEDCRAKLDEPSRLISRLQFIPDESVKDYFSSADVVVLPYRKCITGTSGILQHAAAAGRPVIATNVGEVGSTVQEWNLGIVVSPESPTSLANGVQEFLDRRESLSEEVSERAREYAEEHHWRKMAGKVRKAYLLAGGKKR